MQTHNTEADCWLKYKDYVLDVSDFLAKHEGGKTSISSFCGADITDAFTTKHGSNSEALAEAAELKIGLLTGELEEESPTA
jgi:cytochrome b involved in lipid metabolism